MHVQALEEFTPDERGLFLQFVWGRSRLPLVDSNAHKLPQEMQVDHMNVSGDPDSVLPTSHTCMFTLHLPRYTTAKVLTEKLRYAAYNCKGIDNDGPGDASAYL